MQLRMDSLCFCSSDAGCTHTSLLTGLRFRALLLWLWRRNLQDIVPWPQSSFLVILKQAYIFTRQIRTLIPPWATFSVCRLSVFPQLISYLGMSSATPYPVSLQPQCNPGNPLPSLQSWRIEVHARVCLSVTQRCTLPKPPVLVSEITDSNAGSSKCKDSGAWKIQSRKVENLCEAKKLPWGTLISRSLSISASVM